MHKLIEFICDELDELERKADKDGKLSMAEIQYGDTLAHMKKNLLTADAMMGDGEYSNDGGYYGSYDNMGGRGSYARGRGAKRNSMGRYSRNGYSRAEDDMDGMIDDLKSVMTGLPQEKQREVQKFIQRMEQM